MFSVINQANFTVRRDLEEWDRVAQENVNQALFALYAEEPIRRRIDVNARVVSFIQVEALTAPEDFRGVRDDRGNLQAGAIVIDMDEHLFVEYIATAPWNVTGDSPRAVRKAATALIG